MSASPAIYAAVDDGMGNGMDRRERRRWIVALIIAFALGFVLGWYLLHRNPANCTRSLADNGAQQAAKGNSGTHGAPDKGRGVKLGAPGDGDSSTRPSSGTTTADGGGGAAGSTVSTSAARPYIPRRRSVMPAAIQIRAVFVAGDHARDRRSAFRMKPHALTEAELQYARVGVQLPQ